MYCGSVNKTQRSGGEQSQERKQASENRTRNDADQMDRQRMIPVNYISSSLRVTADLLTAIVTTRALILLRYIKYTMS